MVAMWGGCDYFIPASLECLRGQQLVELIGEDAARRLIAYGADTTIYIAAGKADVLAARTAEMRLMRARGMSLRQIASVEWAQRYTARNVFRLLSQHPEES